MAELTHVVSFRLPEELALYAEELRASFENQTWAEMGRWFFTDPRLHSIILDRIIEAEVEIEMVFD
jgi:hypothetical protein